MIKIEEFIANIVDELEIEEECTANTDFKELEDWSSISLFYLSTYIENEFSVTISFGKFEELTTFQDMYDFIKGSL